MSKAELGEYVSEKSKFVSLLEESQNEVSELIQASNVSEELKRKCADCFRDYLLEFKKASEQIDVYNLARGELCSLLDFINDRDDEQKVLYEALKNVILRARNLALGWKWPPEKI